MRDKNNKKIAEIYYDLFDLLMTSNHRLWRTIALPMPLNHFIVLYFLYNNHMSTITEMANHLAISKQQMSPIVDKLQKKGFIQKECMSNDRRYSQICLTKEGRALIEEQRCLQRANFAQHIVGLSEDDIARFEDSVQMVKAMINKMFKEQM